MPLRSVRFSIFAQYIFKRIIVYQHDNTRGYQERPRGEKETPPPFRQRCLCLKKDYHATKSDLRLNKTIQPNLKKKKKNRQSRQEIESLSSFARSKYNSDTVYDSCTSA